VKAVLVSSLIPNYNKVRCLARAVRSTLRQSLSNLEILISDDCSIDLAENTLLQLQGVDQRVRYWVNRQGLFSNWNPAKCAYSPRGSWILFVDSDDELVNRTAEIDFKAHKITVVDVIEHKRLQLLSSHRICIFEWREVPVREADNTLLLLRCEKEA
jgi:glycosyltransferase involved in cell wall biosynthesis